MFLDDDEKITSVEGPFITSRPTKEFFLVLDLDETLIHFQISDSDENKGILSLRPGLNEFLDNASKHYELMIFTAGTLDVTSFLIRLVCKPYY